MRPDDVRRRLRYLVSLPERTIRSLAAVIAGMTALLTEMILPDAVRDSTIYKITVGMTLQFVTERVAQVKAEGTAPNSLLALDSDFARRKVVGTLLESAGLLAINFSPLWVFAIAADVAAGSSIFLERLAAQLKRNGVIAEDTGIAGLVDVLAAMQEASRKTAIAVDTPPLSRAELARLADELTTSYGRMFSGMAGILPRFEMIWTRMQQVAVKEDVPLESLGGMMTVDPASWGKKVSGTALAIGWTGAELFGEKILDSYAETLERIAAEGLDSYFGRRMKPYLDAARGHFSN